MTINKLFIFPIRIALSLAMLFCHEFGFGQVTETLLSGTSWTVPCGVYSIQVECWGGGGGSGGGTSTGLPGGSGGGGGAYASSTIAVTPSQSIPYSIGSGGAANSTGGNTSWDGATIVAVGGGGGASDGGAPGLGGSAASCTGDVSYNGGDGFSGAGTVGGGGGGSAGNTGNGNSATSQTGAVAVSGGGEGGQGQPKGSNGVSPASGRGGGAGGSGQRQGGSESGGSGAAGQIKITYTPNPMSGTYAIGASGDYSSITALISDLQCATAVGPVIFEIQADYNESLETYPLTFPEVAGVSSVNTITFRPTVSNLVSDGDPGSGIALVSFDNADYYVIDGRIGGTGSTKDWTFRNTRTAATVAQTFLMINDASFNTLKHITIEGEALSTSAALVSIYTSSGSTGNDNNSVLNCDFKDLTGGSAYVPSVGVYIQGSAGLNNDNTLIDNCNFIGLFDATSAFNSNVYVNTNSQNVSITNNHFYQTSSYSGLTNNYNPISINSGGGHIVTGNYIGGSAPSCGGSQMIISSGTAAINGIFFSATCSGDPITVSGNTISNIHYTTTATTVIYPLIGMYLQGSADFICGSSGNGNLIGNMTTNNDFWLTNNSGSGSYGIIGIYNKGSGTNFIDYNSFGGVLLDGTRTAGFCLGVFSNGGTTEVSNNTFGGTIASSFSVTADHHLYVLYNSNSNGITANNNLIQNINHGTSTTNFAGIYSSSGPLISNNNTIHDITSSSNNYSIMLWHQGTTCTANNNNIYNINLTNSGANGQIAVVQFNSSAHVECNGNVIGNTSPDNILIEGQSYSQAIIKDGAGTINCSNNTVQNLTLNGTGVGTIALGINMSAGQATVLGNTVKNIKTFGTTPLTTDYVAIGINVYGVETGHLVSGNAIENVIAASTSAVSSGTIGLYMGQGTGTVEKNVFQGFENRATSSGAHIACIRLGNVGTTGWNIYNNVILADNSPNTNDISIFGIYDNTTGSNAIYHNTISISGSITAGSALTSALYRDLNGLGTDLIKNNIFQNLRTGGTGGHYAEHTLIGGTYTSDFNYLEVADDVNKIGNYSGTDYTIAGWQGAPVNASNSISGTISIDANGYTSGAVQSAGTDLRVQVPEDKDGVSRPSTPWIGAYEGLAKDKDGTVTAGSSAEPASISSLADTDGERVVVLDFKFTDLGTGDGLATIIDGLSIIAGNSNSVSDWNDAIQSAKLTGPDISGALAGTINSNLIEFSLFNMISVDDGSNETYQLEIFLKSDLSSVDDNDILEFKLDYNNITENPNGSFFGSGSVESGDANCAIDITATELRFLTGEPTTVVVTNADFYVSVLATDENGNTDLDETSSVTLVLNSGSGILSSGTGLSQPLSSGTYQWIDVQNNTSETFTIEAQSASLTNQTSISITSVDALIITVGATGDYTTIETAYNTGVPASISQAYIIELQADYNDASEALPINLPAKTGASSSNFITIRPALGVTGTELVGTSSNGNPVINLNGADYVNIDGRPGGVGSNGDWVIRNTNTDDFGVIQLIDDASNNSISYLTLEADVGDLDAIIYIAGTANTTGNDFNVISSNVFRDLTVANGGLAQLPVSAIKSLGTAGKSNDNLIIGDNHFIDVYKNDVGSRACINAVSNTDFVTVSGNHFYQTAPYTTANNFVNNFIILGGAGGHYISDNFMGGSAPFCGGASFSIPSGSDGFEPIRLACTGSACTIIDNTISNITYNSTGGIFRGIYCMTSADYTLKRNTIGSIYEQDKIIFTNNSASGTQAIIGIYMGGSGTNLIDSNYIGGFTVNGSKTGLQTRMLRLKSGSITARFNTLGGTNSNNCKIESDGSFDGIYDDNTTYDQIHDNIIQNIDHDGTTNGFNGIVKTVGTVLIRGNTINNISTESTTGGGTMILHTGGAATIDKNAFSNITLENTGTGTPFELLSMNSTGVMNVTLTTIGSQNSNNILEKGDRVLYAVRHQGTGTLNISGTTIRNVTLNNGGTASQFFGIENTGGTLNCNSNTIENIDVNSTLVDVANYGIHHDVTGSGNVVKDNTISNLHISNLTSTKVHVRAIATYNGDGECSGNFISGLTNQTIIGTSKISGIRIVSGAWDVYNNVIIIDNANYSNDIEIYGIQEDEVALTTNIHHNTVKIGGSVISGTSFTSAYYRFADGVDNLNNNIFQNLRTGGSGGHYAVYADFIAGTFTNDYNYLEVAENTNKLGFWSGTGDRTLAQWQTSTGATNSFTGTVVLNSNGYTSGVIENAGTNLTATVPMDKDGVTRSTTPWLGAFEASSPPPVTLYWVANGGNWNDNSHWSTSSGGGSCTCTPTSNDNAVFDASSFTGPGQVITIPSGTWNANTLDFQDAATQPAIKGSGSLVIGQ